METAAVRCYLRCDDWFEHERWRDYERRLGEQGVKTVCLPHTPDVSSTELRSIPKSVRG
jgi:hypothetical protein